MTLTVAEGEVVVTADMAKTRAGIVSDLGKADKDLGTTGKTFGSKLVGGIGSVLKGGALAVGAVAAAGIGTALTKGFSRLNSIDQAKAKLDGLGNSAKSIDTIMGNALESVKGTAFGLDAAGTVAASAVAAGIQPGAQLTGVLKTIADTATIAGASMEDTGAIFNSVAARGKLQGDDLMQLQERGVPVLAFLAKHYGVTAQAASDMVSQGKVDFAGFSAAMQENLGGAALSSGKTFMGAMANFGASLGRIGAGLLSGIFPKLAPAFSAITTALGPVEGAAKGIGETIGNFVGPAIDRFVKLVQGAPAAFSGLSAVAGPIFQAIGNGIALVQEAWGYFMTGFGPEAAPLMGIVGSLVPLFLQLASSLSPLGLIFQAITPLLPTIGASFGQIATTIGTALLSGLGNVTVLIGNLAGVLSGTLTAILPTIIGFIGMLAEVFATVVPVVSSVLAAVLPLATTLIGQLAPIFTQLATAVLPIVASTLMLVAQAVGPLVSAIMSVLIPVIQALLPVITTVFNAIVPIVTAALTIVKGVIQVVTGIITGNWSQVWSGILNILSGVWGVIKGVVTGAINIVRSVITAGLNIVRSIFSSVWNAVASTVSSVINRVVGFVRNMGAGIGAGVRAAVDFFASMPGKIMSALAGLGDRLLSVGRNLMEGFIRGVSGFAGRMISAVTAPIKGAIDGAKNLLGIHSPSRVFRQIGTYVGQGLEQGLKGSTKGVRTAASKMVNTVLDAAEGGKKAQIKSAVADRLIRTLNTGNNQLLQLAARRGSVATRLKAANTALSKAVKVRDDYRNGVVQGLTKFDVSKASSAGSLLDQLRNRVGQTKLFTSVMSKLRKAGLDDTSFQQFVATGVDALPLAQQLLSGGAGQIRQVASLQGQLSKASTDFAATAANDLYGSGILAARGLIKGLQSQQSALDSQMKKLASSMVSTVKKQLGIHSPSRVFRDEIGAMMGAGIAEGLTASLGGINSAVTGTLSSARAVGVRTANAPVAVAAGGTQVDRSITQDITINEARDPLGSAGRIGAELDKWGRM